MTSTVNADSNERIDQPEDTPLLSTGRSKRDVLAAAVACLGALSLGFVMGYSSPALQDSSLLVVLDSDEKRSWFGSLITLGALFGGPVAAMGVERLGRKTTLMFTNVPLVFGWLLIICTRNYGVMYAGRIITGLGIGSVSLAAPLYIAETASTSRRGTLGTGFQLSVNIGILAAYSLGIALRWDWLAVVGSCVAVLNVLLLMCVPETPSWQVHRGDRDGAMTALRWLHGGHQGSDFHIRREYNEIESSHLARPSKSLSPREFLQPRIYRPVAIALGLMIFQQMSGINAVVFYSASIFRTVGFASPSLASVAVAGVLVIFTLISSALMDCAGRRPLLLLSGTIMTVSIIALGLYSYFAARLQAYTWIALLSLLVYTATFSIGWGPIPWLIMSEILPARARGVASGLVTMSNWILAFVVTRTFSDMTRSLHDYGAYWLFGGFCFASVVFVLLLLPETKGRTLDEIEISFAGDGTSTTAPIREEENQHGDESAR